MLALPASSGARRAPQIAHLRVLDAHLAAQTRSAVLDLYSLDAQLDSARTELGVLRVRAGRLDAQRASISRQLAIAHLDSRLALDRVASRLRYLYDYGTTTSSLDVLLGSSTIGQALTRLDDVDDVASANASVVLQLHLAEAQLSRLSRALETRQRALRLTTASLAATVADLAQAQAQRTSYIASLETQKAYTAEEIGRLTAQAQAAEQRSLALARARAQAERARLTIDPVVPVLTAAPAAEVTPAPAPAAVTPAAAGEQTLTVVATGYSLPGRTSTGLPVGYGVVAVDPSVIPLGAHMAIPGYGSGVAADTGGAIIGSHIDLWFPTTAQALAWGVRTVTISVDG